MSVTRTNAFLFLTLKTVYFLFSPEEHAGVGHHRLVTDYKARLVRRLRFLEAAREKGDAVFRRVAATLELKPRDVTFVAVHHRRGDDFARWHKKRTGKGPIKKAYFYDAMEAMRSVLRLHS